MATPNTCQLQEWLDFAVESAQLAGSLTLGYFNTELRHEVKSDNTPVTEADRQAEELLRSRVERFYPDHAFLGEEFGHRKGTSPARWIVDPIDGTMSFIRGVPLFSNLVGLEWDGQMVVGVIHLPALNETVYAARGLGCRWNGRQAHVSEVSSLEKATMSATTVKNLYAAGRGQAYEKLRDRCYADRGWCDAYAYALLATGRVEIVLDPIMSIWDSAAVLPVVTEAGGTFTDWDGAPTHTGDSVIATNGRLHDAVMSTMGAREV